MLERNIKLYNILRIADYFQLQNKGALKFNVTEEGISLRASHFGCFTFSNNSISYFWNMSRNTTYYLGCDFSYSELYRLQERNIRVIFNTSEEKIKKFQEKDKLFNKTLNNIAPFFKITIEQFLYYFQIVSLIKGLELEYITIAVKSKNTNLNVDGFSFLFSKKRILSIYLNGAALFNGKWITIYNLQDLIKFTIETLEK